MERLMSAVGMVALIGIAWLCSAKKFGLPRKRRVQLWKTVIVGTLLQVVFAVVVFKTAPGQIFFDGVNRVIVRLLSFSEEGARFLFGNLVQHEVPVQAEVPEEIRRSAPTASQVVSGAKMVARTGAFFAFNVLPTIIFFSALMSILYYLGVMQWVVTIFARIMTRFMGTSGAESLSASANIFVGQTEAPLVIRPYVAQLTNSELLAVMTGGMATVAGGVMAAYVGMLQGYIPTIAGHLLTASVMSAPAALVMAKLLLPETEEPKTAGTVKVHYEKTDVNLIDAAANGTTLGLQLAFNVGAMLIAFMSLLALANFIVGWAGGLAGVSGLTLEKIFGWVFAPLAWLMGVPWKECVQAGQFMGEKTVINEFVAYLHMAQWLQQNPGVLSQRTLVIVTYALCGFSNFLSIGIQIGGIGAIAPQRKHDLARLGIPALIAGSLASFQTAVIAGLLF